jgi:hypothetical protein
MAALAQGALPYDWLLIGGVAIVVILALALLASFLSSLRRGVLGDPFSPKRTKPKKPVDAWRESGRRMPVPSKPDKRPDDTGPDADKEPMG